MEGRRPENERQGRPRRQRGPIASFWRERIRPLFSRRLSRLAALVVPHLYMGYMRLVWATSRIEGIDEFARIRRIIEDHDGAVGVLWHEEVMTVAFGYSWVGFPAQTLASLGEAGDVIARMLAMCRFVVFRGGTTTGKARRREGVLRDMIDHMRSHRRVIYGITVDGSKGPAYRMKTGSVVIARECGRPIVLARTWYRRRLRLPTWDRMAVPLPFNVIRYYLRGPFEVPESAATEEGLERFTIEIENELVALAAKSYRDLGQAVPPNLVPREPGERVAP
ncbi:MAG: lysophospholipid acyltransferase family protein [Alphaproteobacteria bacterium]